MKGPVTRHLRSSPIILAGAMLAGGGFTFRADAQPPISTLAMAVGRAELVADVTGVRPGDAFTVGIRIVLEPGWHTYWQNPGDAGMPPSVRWEVPGGCEVGPLQWPVPRRFEENGVISFGYAGEVTLLARVAVPASWTPGVDLPLAADLHWLACRNVNLPGAAHVALSFRVTDETRPAAADARALLEASRLSLPVTDPAWSFSARRDKAGKILRLRVKPPSALGPSCLTGASFFPLQRGLVDDAAPAEWSISRSAAELTLGGVADSPKPIDALRGVLVLAPRDGAAPLALEVVAPWSR